MLYQSLQIYIYVESLILENMSQRITRTRILSLVLFRIDYCGSLFSDINNTDIKNTQYYSRFYTNYVLC